MGPPLPAFSHLAPTTSDLTSLLAHTAMPLLTTAIRCTTHSWLCQFPACPPAFCPYTAHATPCRTRHLPYHTPPLPSMPLRACHPHHLPALPTAYTFYLFVALPPTTHCTTAHTRTTHPRTREGPTALTHAPHHSPAVTLQLPRCHTCPYRPPGQSSRRATALPGHTWLLRGGTARRAHTVPFARLQRLRQHAHTPATPRTTHACTNMAKTGIAGHSAGHGGYRYTAYCLRLRRARCRSLLPAAPTCYTYYAPLFTTTAHRVLHHTSPPTYVTCHACLTARCCLHTAYILHAVLLVAAALLYRLSAHVFYWTVRTACCLLRTAYLPQAGRHALTSGGRYSS